MLAPYRRLFAAKGALGFTATGFLARLALSMSGVGTVVMIAAVRHSYALAGAVSGAALAATLVTIPLLGRLVDRYGQARTAVPAALWSSLMSAALVVCLATDAPTWTLFVTNVLSATAPNVGGMARARWAELYGDDDRMHVANSFEQVLDELCFVLGPVVVVALATGVAPEAGRVAPLVLTLAGTVLFCLQRGTEPPVRPADPSAGRSPLANRGLQVMIAVFLFTGSLFGSLEVVTIAFTDSLGHKSSAGVVLALQAVGSALSGLLFGLLTLRGSGPTRFLLGVGGMALLMLPLTLATGMASLVPLMFIAGMATSPTMITGMGLVQELIPRARINEGMTLAVTGLLGGSSLGSTLAGWAVERFGAASGYWLPVGAAALALLTAVTGLGRLRATLAPAAAAPLAHDNAVARQRS
ncbi:MFS transporter [Streptomyces sp. NEAU-sy36]|uniref:MFS transporter n=1 Tax=unclassified Streptomyces TaxID=2593676 RepID=UPI0015D64899|nr:MULTISPECIES: MFS transporter [unclassified Streptomyces]QLJ01755.1 MFS transporter [Streptomyces sp. NEAU-sy36]